MNKDLKLAAEEMGYRKYGESDHVMAKPHGFSLYVVSETEAHGIEFTQYFRVANRPDDAVWTYKSYREEDHGPSFLRWIQYAETQYPRHKSDDYQWGGFEFLTRAEQIHRSLERKT